MREQHCAENHTAIGKAAAARRSRGFALLIVLWGLVALGLVIAHLTATGRSEAKIAQNMLANAEAAAAADGGVAAAIYHLSEADEHLRWAADGSVHQIRIGAVPVRVRSRSEAGKVNPNLASNALMAALFQASGVDPSVAGRLAAAIGGWHDSARQSPPGGGGSGDYAAAGKSYGPPGNAIEHLDELGRVVGMTPDVLADLKPHLSLWNPQETPDPAETDPVVAQALVLMARATGEKPPATPNSAVAVVNIVATAVIPSGAAFTRRTVVRIEPGVEKGYRILTWESGGTE